MSMIKLYLWITKTDKATKTKMAVWISKVFIKTLIYIGIYTLDKLFFLIYNDNIKKREEKIL